MTGHGFFFYSFFAFLPPRFILLLFCCDHYYLPSHVVLPIPFVTFLRFLAKARIFNIFPMVDRRRA
jgi:hypothetical protein